MRSSNRKSLGAFTAVLACAVALLGIGAPVAGAAPEAQPGWGSTLTFGEGGQGTSPLAVDGDGNVFASNNGEANAYRPDTSFLAHYGFTGIIRNIAIDPGDGTVYVDELFGGTSISRWLSDGEPTPAYTADPGFNVPAGAGLAVDPTTHDLLVTDPEAETVRRYDTTGTLVTEIATPSINPVWIAAAPDGSFYVAPAEGPEVTHLSGTGTVLGTIAGVGVIRGLTVEPTDGLLVASVDGGRLKTYSSSGQFLSDVAAVGAGGLAGDSGLLYLSTSSINVYVRAIVPGVEAPVLTEIQATSVHVEAEVDPGAGPPEGSVAHFEYSEDGGKSWVPTPDQTLEGPERPETIEADIEGLELNSDFLVRVKASNPLVFKISDATPFSTPEVAPFVEVGPESDLTETTVRLNGTVNPAGLLAGYHFEYGTTTAYGSRVPLSTEAPAGNQRAPLAVSQFIAGLQPGTTYHYRLVAENAVGRTDGVDHTFTTVDPSEAFPARAYELVTPVEKNGAQVNGNGNFLSAADGSWMVVGTGSAEADGASALIWNHYLTRRGTAGWPDWTQLEAPVEISPGVAEGSFMGVSADGNHALIVSNKALAPGATAGDGNLYVSDTRTATYEFVGSSPGNSGYQQLVGLQRPAKIFLAGADDFSWIVFNSEAPLLPGVTSAQMYRWSRTGGLELESRKPDGSISPGDVLTPHPGLYENRQVSDDGKVSYFSLRPGIAGVDFGVFRRENGQTTPISVIEGDSTNTPQFGFIDGVSRDGRYAIFHTFAPLTPDTPAGLQAALYQYDATTGDLTFISEAVGGEAAVMDVSDDGQTVYINDTRDLIVWRNGNLHVVAPEPLAATGVASPNGRYFTWVEVTSPDFTGRLYLHDADTDQTVCVSCPPGGGAGDGAYLLNAGRNPGNQAARLIHDDGLLFFSTRLQLVAADRNGTEDVYAYKHGRLNLISPGNAEYAAKIMDSSVDGRNVFFQTDQPLVPWDTNGDLDVYDARVGGGFSGPPPLPPGCAGDDCKGPLSSLPVFGAPGSAAGDAGSRKGAAARISGLRKLTAADRTALANGGVARLKMTVSGPGTVTVTGTASVGAKKHRVVSATATTRKGGPVSVPLRLSKGALSELGEDGSLTVRMTVRFKDAPPKTVSFALRSSAAKKGGRS